MADVPTPEEPRGTLHCNNCDCDVTINQCETHPDHIKDGLCYPEHLAKYHIPKEEGEEKVEEKVEA